MAKEVNVQTETNYYQLNHDRFMEWFREQADQALAYLSKKMSIDAARKICADAREEFEKQLPNLPNIGGDQGIGTRWMLLAALWVSFFRPLKAKGTKVSDIGRTMYDLYEAQLEATPREEFLKIGAERFSEAYIAEMKTRSKTSTPLYEKDFVLTYVDGQGEDFDYGFDVQFCPCADYFKEQEAEELAPYFCLVDIPENKRMGTGLVRTKTLAKGDDLCNFRFKKGRKMLQDWDSEAAKFPQKKPVSLL